MLKSTLNSLFTSFQQRQRFRMQICMNHHSATTAVLPRLPIPDLQKTLAKYLESLRPILLEDSARGGAPYDDAFALRRKWADEFAVGVGRLCQERLHELDKTSPNNWLDDNFWLKTAYLQWRAPLLVNSNWWLAFNDDSLHPAEEHQRSGFTDWQIQRAAWLACRVLEFKDKIDAQELYSETTRTGVWIRESVSKMFNSVRKPQLDCDTLSPISPPSDPLSYNVIVVVNNWFYTLQAYDPSLEDSNSRSLINPQTFRSRLDSIVRDATTRCGVAPEIGVLSADDRDIWASNLQHLLTVSPDNLQAHEVIAKALMCICLDNETHTIAPSSLSSSLYQPSKISQATLDSHLHAIRSVASNVSNRFFDKPISIIVDPSGRAGAMGEHSPCDALVPSIVTEYAIVEEVETTSSLPDEPTSEGWSRLDWIIDDRVTIATRDARERAKKIISNSDDTVLWFEAYGVDWIKGAGFSADAYVQMVLQLAWYRTMGEFTATYETVLTRMFNKGRTETARTLSQESRAFVLAMTKSNPIETKLELLRRAIQKHTSLTRDAATGRGIDRHLLGLRNMLQEGERCELFDDPFFAKSQEWRLSTSGLSAGHHFRGTGFGTSYENGYGINYLAGPTMIKFGIETKFSGKNTSADKFKSAIIEALYEMRLIVTQNELSKSRNLDNEALGA